MIRLHTGKSAYGKIEVVDYDPVILAEYRGQSIPVFIDFTEPPGASPANSTK